MTTYYNNENTGFVKSVPVVKQLNAIFRAIPDNDLIAALKAPTGRPGYTVVVLWKTYIAMVVLGLPTFASLIRTLQNNPFIAIACGITSDDDIPTKFAYSRFMRKLSHPKHVVMVKNIMRSLTRSLYNALPDFGRSVAIDSTDLKAWSNGAKKPVADPDATWAAKLDTSGKKKFYFGYKLHLLADTRYELPIAASVATGSANDMRIASRVLSEARFTNSKFHPKYIIGDAGYSSDKLRRLIRRQYRAEPIIKVNRAHKKALFTETEEWKALYNRRTSIERLFGRLKCYRRLNNVTVRRKHKVTVHCFLSLIVVQAQALHSATSNKISSVRQCVYATI
ncbi:MAG TPA: transposase [Dehalococcoidia bacterium]|nr:transposase [Dehalococcoidia bacterium]